MSFQGAESSPQPVQVVKSWKLRLTDDDKFDGEDQDVWEFCDRLRGEVQAAVRQGYLANADAALNYLSSSQFSGTALTWVNGCAEDGEFETFEAFLDGLVNWFGKKVDDTDRRMTTMSMKKKPKETSRAFAIRLKSANKRLPADSQLDDKELKYAFLYGHKKASLKKLQVAGKYWGHADVSFKAVVDKVHERLEQNDGSDDDTPRRGASASELKELVESTAEAAAQKTRAGMDKELKAIKDSRDGLGKELAAIKEELRLTGVGRTRMPPRRVFLTESDEQFLDEEQEAEDVYLADAGRGPYPSNGSYPYNKPRPYGYQQGYQRPLQQSRPWYGNQQNAAQQSAPQLPPGQPPASAPDAVAQSLQQLTTMMGQLLQLQAGNNQPTTATQTNQPNPAGGSQPSQAQRKDFGNRT